MRKQHAIDLLGGKHKTAARELGLTPQGFAAWPEVLPRSKADRVLGARLRIEWREALRTLPGQLAASQLDPVMQAALGLEVGRELGQEA